MSQMSRSEVQRKAERDWARLEPLRNAYQGDKQAFMRLKMEDFDRDTRAGKAIPGQIPSFPQVPLGVGSVSNNWRPPPAAARASQESEPAASTGLHGRVSGGAVITSEGQQYVGLADHMSVDEARARRAELDRQARAYTVQNPGVDYVAAVKAVQGGRQS